MRCGLVNIQLTTRATRTPVYVVPGQVKFNVIGGFGFNCIIKRPVWNGMLAGGLGDYQQHTTPPIIPAKEVIICEHWIKRFEEGKHET